MSLFDRGTYRLWILASAALAGTPLALAQDSNNPFDTNGINGIPGGNNVDVKQIIINVIKFILDFLAVLAVIFIIIAGIRLIASQGDESAKDKAKKSIIYVVAGLIVVLISRVLVGFVGSTATNWIN
jgi:hypothetical protein